MYPTPIAPASGTGVAAAGGVMGSASIMAIGIAIVVISLVLMGATGLFKNSKKLDD